MRTAAIFVSSVVFIAFIACVNYGGGVVDFEQPTADASIDPNDSGAPAVVDAAALRDASADRYVADAGSSCPLPNLLLNPDFESGQTPWDESSSNISMITTGSAHRGIRYARVCGATTDAGAASYLLKQTLVSGLPSRNYVLRGWFRVSSGGSADSTPLILNLNDNVPPAETQKLAHGSVVWTCGLVKAALPLKIVDIGFQLLANEQMCVDIDDVALYEVTSLAADLPPGCGCQ
jgi:hypothetical protein